MGGGGYMMTALTRATMKQKGKEKETEDLKGSGLEKHHQECQSNPLLSFRHKCGYCTLPR